MNAKEAMQNDKGSNRRRLHLAIAWAGFVVLILLHLDFWRPRRAELYFGWLPEEIAYRLVWMLLAFVYLLHHCAFLWPGKDAPDGPEDRAR